MIYSAISDWLSLIVPNRKSIFIWGIAPSELCISRQDNRLQKQSNLIRDPETWRGKRQFSVFWKWNSRAPRSLQAPCPLQKSSKKISGAFLYSCQGVLSEATLCWITLRERRLCQEMQPVCGISFIGMDCAWVWYDHWETVLSWQRHTGMFESSWIEEGPQSWMANRSGDCSMYGFSRRLHYSWSERSTFSRLPPRGPFGEGRQ